MRYELGQRRRHEISTAVVAIDRDVFLREVASQHPVAPLAEPERDLERDLLLLHRRGDLRLIIGAVARALVGDANAAKPDRELVAIGGLAGFADGHDHAAP